MFRHVLSDPPRHYDTKRKDKQQLSTARKKKKTGHESGSLSCDLARHGKHTQQQVTTPLVPNPTHPAVSSLPTVKHFRFNFKRAEATKPALFQMLKPPPPPPARRTKTAYRINSSRETATATSELPSVTNSSTESPRDAITHARFFFFARSPFFRICRFGFLLSSRSKKTMIDQNPPHHRNQAGSTNPSTELCCCAMSTSEREREGGSMDGWMDGWMDERKKEWQETKWRIETSCLACIMVVFGLIHFSVSVSCRHCTSLDSCFDRLFSVFRVCSGFVEEARKRRAEWQRRLSQSIHHTDRGAAFFSSSFALGECSVVVAFAGMVRREEPELRCSREGRKFCELPRRAHACRLSTLSERGC